MSWYSALKKEANDYLNNNDADYKNEMAAYLYGLECLPEPTVDKPVQHADDDPEAVKNFHAEYNEVEETLDSFVAFAQSIDNECDIACQYGNEDGNPLNKFWSTHVIDYLTKLDSALAFASRMPIPHKPRLPQVQNENSIKEYIRQLAEYYQMDCIRLNLQRRVNSAKVAADILNFIKHFEILAYSGQFNDAREILSKINNYIENAHQNYFYNEFSASVLAKLVHLQCRINEQFGFEQFDRPDAPTRLSQIIDKFQNGINISVYKLNNEDKIIEETPEPTRRKRLEDVVAFTRNNLKDVDLAHYTPGFWGKLGRWFMSLFRTTSHYVNDTPDKQAWASVVSNITYNIVPKYFEQGSDYFEKEFPNSGLSTRVKNPPNIAALANKNVKKIASQFVKLKDSLGDLFDKEKNRLNSRNVMSQQQISQTASNVCALLSPYYVENKFFVEPAEITGIKQNVHTPYQVEWPTESLSKLNPVELKAYAEKLAKCIKAILASGQQDQIKLVQEKLVNTLVPGLYRFFDISFIKAAFTKPQAVCVDLAFYKHLLCEIFKGEPNTWPESMKFMANAKADNDSDDVKLWKDMCKFKRIACEKYDINLKAFTHDGVEFDEVKDKESLKNIRETIVSLTDRIWRWPVPKSRHVACKGNQIDVSRFYYKVTMLRTQLLQKLVPSHNTNDESKKEIIKEIQKLQKLEITDLSGLKHDDNVNLILACNDSRGSVKLLAALNAVCNKFIRLPAIGHSYSEFFSTEEPNLGYSSLTFIYQFMNDHNLQTSGAPFDQIFNLVEECIGIKSAVTTSVMKSQPVTPHRVEADKVSPTRSDAGNQLSGSKKNGSDISNRSSGAISACSSFERQMSNGSPELKDKKQPAGSNGHSPPRDEGSSKSNSTVEKDANRTNSTVAKI